MELINLNKWIWLGLNAWRWTLYAWVGSSGLGVERSVPVPLPLFCIHYCLLPIASCLNLPSHAQKPYEFLRQLYRLRIQQVC